MSTSITFPRGPGIHLTFCRFDNRTHTATITIDGTDGHIAYAACAPDGFKIINDLAHGRTQAWLDRAAFELSAKEAAHVAENFGLTIEDYA